MREAEYSSLRAEILEEQGGQANLLIAMYTIFIATITFAISQTNTYLFFMDILVSLFFKLQILWKQAGIQRISSYIIVKFESEKELGISWETDLLEAEKYRETKFKRWFKIISLSSSKMSTFLIIITYIINLLVLYQSVETLTVAIIEIILGAIVIFITLYIDILQPQDKLREKFIQEFSQLKDNEK